MVYLDNAATTWPKPHTVTNSMRGALEKFGANPGRSSYRMAATAAEKVFEARSSLSDFFGCSGPENIIFTLNCTHALNMVLKGTLTRGDHVIVSSLEHNAVMRPVHDMAKRGVSYSAAHVFPCDFDKTLQSFENLIRPNTKAIVCMHASNVFGIRLPIEQIGVLCKTHGLLFVVDAAQSAGVLPIQVEHFNIDFLCVPGHKGLYGPSGTGFIAAGKNAPALATIIEGGTGNNSLSYDQPAELPERLESGTINLPGIIGLKSGVDFVKSHGIDNIRRDEARLTSVCYSELSVMDGVELYMPPFDDSFFVPLLSFNLKDLGSEEAASALSEQGIAVRAGLHCCPAAHKAFGTATSGTVRICPSVYTTKANLEYFVNCVRYILKN